MTSLATRHAPIEMKNLFEARNLKIIIDEEQILHWYPLLLIQLLHVITFKLHKNKICDMKGP